MARPRVRVTCARREPDEVPEQLTEFLALLLTLGGEDDLLDHIERHVRIERKSGSYGGFDVFLFLLGALCLRVSLKDLHQDYGRIHGPKLAAAAGRDGLPSSSAVSNALKSCTQEEADAATDWLLTASVLVPELLHDPGAAFHDTLGLTWHLLDYDPTVHALRHRALPEGDDLPPPRRRTDRLAKPGRTGRKRGEVQISRATLEHVGTGLWVGLDVGPGNGKPRQDLIRAAARTASWCTRFGIPLDRVVIRFDGGNSGVAALTECRLAGLIPLTRLHCYSRLEDPEIRASLASATWQEVEDSRSGPTRQAAELGELLLTPSERTARADGRPYEPLRIRVVVTRCPAEQAGSTGRHAAPISWCARPPSPPLRPRWMAEPLRWPGACASHARRCILGGPNDGDGAWRGFLLLVVD